MRFSALVALAALLCFAGDAFGQSTFHGQVGSGSIVLSQTALSQTSAIVIALAFGPGGRGGHDHDGGNGYGNGNGNGNRDGNGNGNGNGNGCGNQNWGWGQGGGCSQVPEGGATFAYIALAGLCCLAAAIFRIRQQTRVSETN